MNLAFTKPAENSKLQEDLSFGKVELMLIDMFMNVSAVGEAGNVDNVETVPVAASAGDGDGLDVSGSNKRNMRKSPKLCTGTLGRSRVPWRRALRFQL